MTDVWINAVGVQSALGLGVEALEQGLRSPSDSALSHATRGIVDTAVRANPPDAATLLKQCWDQLDKQCGTQNALRGRDTGLVLGAATGCQPVWRPDSPSKFLDEATNIDEFCEHKLADELRRSRSLEGPSLVVNAACASSACAVGIAADLVDSGVYERAVVGGSETLSWFDVHGFRSARLLSSDGARPFDKQRAGTALAFGAGLVLVERQRRETQSFARLTGWAMNNEATSIATPEEDGHTLALCIRKALECAGLQPGQIDYVNAHGTGTVSNDASEVRALRSVWPRADEAPYVSSTKGLLGHLRAASGVVELIAAALCLKLGLVPTNHGAVELDPLCDSRFVVGEARLMSMNRVMSISRGFGGSNVVLILEAPDQRDASRTVEAVA